MKTITTSLLILICTFAYGQSFDITGGVNHSIFHEGNNYYSLSNYETEPGFVLRFGLNDVEFGKLKTRVDLTLVNYGGDLHIIRGSPRYGQGFKGSIRKTNLAIGFNPVNLTFFKSFRFTTGLNLSGLVYERAEGATSWNRYSVPLTLGLQSGLAKSFSIGDKRSINLQYTFDYGLTSEFARFIDRTKCMRHSITIGFQQRSKPIKISSTF